MIVVFSFSNKLTISTLPNSFNFNEGIVLHNEYYELSNSPIGFELGFYNFLISDNQLVGINFQFNDSTLKNNHFLSQEYADVKIEEGELIVFFKNTNDYSIDYSQEFLDFYLLKSKNGSLAFTINITEHFDYDLSLLLKISI